MFQRECVIILHYVCNIYTVSACHGRIRVYDNSIPLGFRAMVFTLPGVGHPGLLIF